MSQGDSNDKFKRLIHSEEETHAEVPAQPFGAAEPLPSHPALDKDNMPLPRRVNQMDMEGTRVTPAAFEPTTRRRNANQQNVRRRNGNWFPRFRNHRLPDSSLDRAGLSFGHRRFIHPFARRI